VNPTAPACSPRPPAPIAPLKLDSNGPPGCRPWPTAARPWRTVVLRRTPTAGGHTRRAQALGNQGGPSYATVGGYGEAVRRDRVRSPAATMVAMPRWCTAAMSLTYSSAGSVRALTRSERRWRSCGMNGGGGGAAASSSELGGAMARRRLFSAAPARARERIEGEDERNGKQARPSSARQRATASGRPRRVAATRWASPDAVGRVARRGADRRAEAGRARRGAGLGRGGRSARCAAGGDAGQAGFGRRARNEAQGPRRRKNPFPNKTFKEFLNDIFQILF